MQSVIEILKIFLLLNIFPIRKYILYILYISYLFKNLFPTDPTIYILIIKDDLFD